MACILKLPTKSAKGVVTFTDRERDMIIAKNANLQKKILSLKSKWVVGMHHNWVTFDSPYNHIFDFAMYLPSYTGKLPLVPFVATNFAPEFFKPSSNEKFWDILYVARAVKFKNIPDFFQCIRSLYDQGKKYRVLFICPIPPYKWINRRNHFYEIRKVYDEMFSEEEKDIFTLLTIDYRDPSPFDLETLAHFYKSSKIFVHASNKEKQGRAVGYAWSCGMPVVGLSCIGTPLPSELKTKPYFYEAFGYDDFPKLVSEAVEEIKNKISSLSDWSKVMNMFKESENTRKLSLELKKSFSSKHLPYEPGKEFFHKLDFFLSNHYIIAKK